MPTKRELRELEENKVNEDLENTVQLDLDEIMKVEKTDELDVPDFSSRAPQASLGQSSSNDQPSSSGRPLDNDQPLDDYEDEDDDDDIITIPRPIMIGLVVFIAFLAAVLVLLFNNISKTSQPQSNDDAPVATVESEATPTLSLDFYHEQAVKTAVKKVLSDEFGTDYTEPSVSQFEYDGSETDLTVTFKAEVGDTYDKTYVMPTSLDLVWDNDTEAYKVTSYSIDKESAEESGWTSNSTKKEAKEQAEETAVEGREVSNFTVTVRNNVTVTVTAKGSGRVVAYAVSEDGTRTELASAEGETVTQTTDLEAGNYELILYAEEGAGYSWSYNLG